MNHFSVLTWLLSDRDHFLDEVRDRIKLETKIASLLITSSFLLAIYGGIMGLYSGGAQVISSALKLPALYLITLVVCLPTLYFFDLLLGSKLSFKQYVALGLALVASASVLLFSFAPIILFFLISVQGYNFFLLLNVLIMGATGYISVRLFYSGMRSMPQHTNADENLRRQLLQGWVVLYGLIGSQLGWTLSPFVGIRGEPFQIFRTELDGNFYAEVARAISALLGLS